MMILQLWNSGLPSGLACLQRNFPCNRGPGIYYNFGINCGGPEITSSSDGIVYEKENEPFGPASCFVTGTTRWGVSNVGYFAGRTNAPYTSFSLSQFTNTFDSVLFQTARLSASSIRYFGLGLENGNYTVNLKFAEHVILAATTERFLGRRLFDIYIQHIEDLTQEKFSLQRALEASRALAESLASKNYSLTETYNQQRSVVDQLKSNVETLQAEIKAQMVRVDNPLFLVILDLIYI